MWEVLDAGYSAILSATKAQTLRGAREMLSRGCGCWNLTLAKVAVGLGVTSLQKGESKGSWTLPAILWG